MLNMTGNVFQVDMGSLTHILGMILKPCATSPNSTVM